MELYKRIRLRREELGMSQSELARRLGYKDRSTIAKIEAGINDITQTKIEAFAKALNTTASELMGWEDPSSPNLNLPAPSITDDVISFPIITSVAAHYGCISYDESLTEDSIEIPREYLRGHSPSEYCCMRVKGDSMYPDYRDGDIVLVLKQNSLYHSGQVGVVIYEDDEMTLKRINYVSGEDWMELIPINPAYPSKRIEGEALAHCRIVGIPRFLLRDL